MSGVKGIVLAGGTGTRLYPVTRAVSKHLLPVYDKPMVYFPLSILMLAGIRDILVVTTPHDRDAFERLLGDGSQWGLRLSYAVQPRPEGIAQAFLIGRDFIGDSRVALVLGDNIFYGHGLAGVLQAAAARPRATAFAYRVLDPERYGVVAFDGENRPVSIVEKPRTPPSRWAVTGLYFYGPEVVEAAAALRPSARGELEITDLNVHYLERGALHVERLGRGVAWLDTGTHEGLLQAAEFVRTVQHRQGLQIASLEEVAFRMSFIDRARLERLAAGLGDTAYAAHLRQVAAEDGEPPA